MKEATIEFIQKIFGEDSDIQSDWKGDNAFQGLQILAKYMNPLLENLITGADHDVMYGADVYLLIEKGITEEDVVKLAKLNWSFDDEAESFNCFV